MTMHGWTSDALKGKKVISDTGAKTPARRKNKMGNVHCTSPLPMLAGRSFGSKGERERGVELCLLQMGGEISNLEFQVRTHLTARVYWKVDFRYEEDGRTVYEDFKGFEGDRYKVLVQLWPEHGPALLRITMRDPRTKKIRVTRTIMPKMKGDHSP